MLYQAIELKISEMVKARSGALSKQDALDLLGTLDEELKAETESIYSAQARFPLILTDQSEGVLGYAAVYIELLDSLCRTIFQTTYEYSDSDARRNYIGTVSRLVGRIILVSREILCLISNGYSGGAQSRWRTMYELHLFHLLIRKFGFVGSQLYAESYILEAYLLLKANGETDGSQFVHFSEQLNSLKKKHGERFAQPLGWAACLLKVDKIDIRKISKALEADHDSDFTELHHLYKLASTSVHGGVLGNELNFGTLTNRERIQTRPELEIDYVLLANTLRVINKVVEQTVLERPNTKSAYWFSLLSALSFRMMEKMRGLTSRST